jgi:hypothetical protein
LTSCAVISLLSVISYLLSVATCNWMWLIKLQLLSQHDNDLRERVRIVSHVLVLNYVYSWACVHNYVGWLRMNERGVGIGSKNGIN